MNIKEYKKEYCRKYRESHKEERHLDVAHISCNSKKGTKTIKEFLVDYKESEGE